MTRMGALPADQQYADLARAGSWPARHGARATGTSATKGRSPWVRRLASPQGSRGVQRFGALALAGLLGLTGRRRADRVDRVRSPVGAHRRAGGRRRRGRRGLDADDLRRRGHLQHRQRHDRQPGERSPKLPPMDNVNVVAMVDLPEQTDPGYPQATLPGLAPFTTTKIVVLDGGRWNEVADLGEVSMGRPDALAALHRARRGPSTRPTSTAWCSPTTAAPGPAATRTPARRRPRS